VYGLGEVRDGASKNYALVLKSRLLGENPCNVDKIFRKIKQFGGHARQGGGVCGVEMALWDIAGKVYNVPVYQMLGGKFRDKVRAAIPESRNPKVRQRMKGGEMGFTCEDGPGCGMIAACRAHHQPLHKSAGTATPFILQAWRSPQRH
jgi:L-alanine-DL-glutamate epimerase-like enolase superfamily enzyme